MGGKENICHKYSSLPIETMKIDVKSNQGHFHFVPLFLLIPSFRLMMTGTLTWKSIAVLCNVLYLCIWEVGGKVC